MFSITHWKNSVLIAGPAPTQEFTNLSVLHTKCAGSFVGHNHLHDRDRDWTFEKCIDM
jgi:hypothetical protein